MTFYITKWTEFDDKFLPIYQRENEVDDDLKDDEFKFVGDLDSPEFEKHFNDNIIINLK